MKVLCVIDSLAGGGAERAMCGLANFLAARQCTVLMAPFRDITPAIALDERIRVEPLAIGPRPPSLIGKLGRAYRLYAELRRRIHSAQADVVLSFMDQANVLALLAAVGSGIPVVISERVHPQSSSLALRFNLPIVRSAYAFLRDTLYRSAAAIVLQTERNRESFRARLQPQIAIIPNAILPEDTRQESDKRLPIKSILCLGRLSSQKRFDRAIRAFDTLAPRFPEWHLVICGSGEQFESLNKQRSSSCAPDRIHLLGMTTTPLAVMRQAAVFLLPSDYEGFPTALLEAMSQGCACIATDCPTGPRELLGKSAGILVPPEDERRLAESLESLLQSPEQRSLLAAEARHSAESYLPQQIFPLWSELLTGIVAKARGLQTRNERN